MDTLEAVGLALVAVAVMVGSTALATDGGEEAIAAWVLLVPGLFLLSLEGARRSGARAALVLLALGCALALASEPHTLGRDAWIGASSGLVLLPARTFESFAFLGVLVIAALVAVSGRPRVTGPLVGLAALSFAPIFAALSPGNLNESGVVDFGPLTLAPRTVMFGLALSHVFVLAALAVPSNRDRVGCAD